MDSNTKNLLLYAGLGTALYFAIIKPILEKAGIQETAEQKATKKLVKQGKDKFIADALKTNKPTRNEGAFALYADQIWEYLKYSAIDDNKTGAYNLLMTYIHNDGDIALLIKYFGKRSEYVFGFPVGEPKSLSEFVTGNLSSGALESINNAYAKSKMRFRF